MDKYIHYGVLYMKRHFKWDKHKKCIIRKWKGKIGGDTMENVMERTITFNKSLMDEISKKLPLISGQNGMIKLDKNDESDKEWFDED